MLDNRQKHNIQKIIINILKQKANIGLSLNRNFTTYYLCHYFNIGDQSCETG